MLRTDLALEAKEMYHESVGNTDAIDGVEASSYTVSDIAVTKVNVLTQKGSKSIGKPVGRYITFEMPDFLRYGFFYHNHIAELIKQELLNILPDSSQKQNFQEGFIDKFQTRKKDVIENASFNYIDSSCQLSILADKFSLIPLPIVYLTLNSITPCPTR